MRPARGARNLLRLRHLRPGMVPKHGPKAPDAQLGHDRLPPMSPEGAGRFSGRGTRGVGELRGQASFVGVVA